MQESPQHVNDIHCHTIMPNKYAVKMNESISKILAGKSYSYKRRRIRVLNAFIGYCFEHSLFMKNGVDVSQCFSAWQEEFFNGGNEKQPHTIVSDARALWGALSKLCKRAIDGLPETNSIVPPRRLSQDVYTNTANSTAKVLGGFDLPTNIKGQSITLSLETDVDIFIKSLIDTMRKHRDVIYKVSKQYLDDALTRYAFAQEAASKVSIDKFLNNPDLLHPEQRGHGVGQHLSLFSNHLRDGECGYTNLIAYITHCHNGLINRHFPGGNNHLYRFTNNQYELREHFGLSSLSAVAASNIIIIESGINTEAIRQLALSAQGSTNKFFEPSSHGFRVSYHKPRAKGFLKRNLKHASDEPYIEKAFNYAAEVTSHHRSMISESSALRLFIHDSAQSTGKITPISDYPFKRGFRTLLKEAKELLKDNPDWCRDVTPDCIDEVLQHQPNAKKLRATEGVIRWYDSGGNPAVAAKYLGNSEAVSIRNYLPKELQLAVYNQRVRRFQNVLIASATNGEDYQIKALDLQNETELKDYLSRLDKRVPHWKSVMRTLSGSSDLSKAGAKEVKVTLDICPENIAVMKACNEIEIDRINKGVNVNDGIKELSFVYQALNEYLNTHPDRKLHRTIRKGDRMYEEQTCSYSDLRITKTEVNNGIS
ncbi:hypothetical protein QRL17_000917 [Vibrio parahaemolyticus]|nr:hypothetical protein [Vibrio parahaemolyticus]ELA9886410.1 hypothetical protein [Vibrio parahaemolyticus]